MLAQFNDQQMFNNSYLVTYRCQIILGNFNTLRFTTPPLILNLHFAIQHCGIIKIALLSSSLNVLQFNPQDKNQISRLLILSYCSISYRTCCRCVHPSRNKYCTCDEPFVNQSVSESESESLVCKFLSSCKSPPDRAES